MPSRRRLLTTVGVSVSAVVSGCTGAFSMGGNDAPGSMYPGGTMVVYNTSESDLSVTVTTVDHSPTATFESVVPATDMATRRGFVSASAGTSVTLKARVESFAEDGISDTFMPNGGGSEDDTPPQYAMLNIPGSDGDVTWQSREASG